MNIDLFKESLPYRPKNVQINDISTLPGNSAQELYYAGDVIGNYAKKHNANIRFYDISKDYYDTCEFDNPAIERKLRGCVGIDVTKKGKTSGTWLKYESNDNTPFLRRVYEKLQTLIEGKHSRIIEEKANTLSNLIIKGKIKA